MTSTSDSSPRFSGERPDPFGTAPAWQLVLMASPMAAANNATVLILDDIGRAMGTTTANAAWVATAYALALAVATPLQAALMRNRGELFLLWASALLVTAGTLIVLFSPWLSVTVAGRATQAAGGAGLNVLAIALAGSSRRIGAISAGMGVFGAIGPLLGTQLTNAVSWRAALALLAVTLIAVPFVHRYSARRPSSDKGFDAKGALLLAVFSASIVLLAAYSLPALMTTALSAILLLIHVKRHPDGYVPAATIRSSRFLVAAGVALGLSGAYFTLLFIIPQLLTIRAGWTKDLAATGQLIAMVLASLTTLGFTLISARFNRAEIRILLIGTGSVAILITIWATSPLLLLISIFLALFSATSASATQVSEAFTAVPHRQRSTAIGLFTLTYLLGGAIGPALAALLVFS